MTAYDRQPSEVFVERDEDSTFSVSLRQDLFITGIRFGLPGMHSVVPRGRQLSLRTTCNAGIEQQLHPLVSATDRMTQNRNQVISEAPPSVRRRNLLEHPT